MTPDEIAKQFLQAYADGGEPEGGWLHAKALQQTRLDFSDESLVRLDRLLAQIRERAAPSAADLASVRGRNFQSLIVFHVIEMARRRTHADVVWHDRASALRVLPAGTQLPDGSFTRLVANAPDQRALFVPLAWLEAQLRSADEAVPGADYLAGVVATLEEDGPPVWWRAMHAMGRMASWQMMMAADGGAVVPMMLRERAPDTWISLVGGSGPVPGADVDASLEMGSRQLEKNAEGHAWQVLSYDGWWEEGGARIDAVMVIVRTYGPRPLKLKLAFPYRPARGGRRFTILQPALHSGNVPNETVAKFGATLERGIQSVKWAFGTTWNELREGGGGSPPPSSSPASPAAPGPAWAAPAPPRARPAPSTSAPPPKKPGWKPW